MLIWFKDGKQTSFFCKNFYQKEGKLPLKIDEWIVFAQTKIFLVLCNVIFISRCGLFSFWNILRRKFFQFIYFIKFNLFYCKQKVKTDDSSTCFSIEYLEISTSFVFFINFRSLITSTLRTQAVNWWPHSFFHMSQITLINFWKAGN